MKNLFLFLLFISSYSFLNAQNLFIETNKVVEWSYYSDKLYIDPFNQVDLYAVITDANGNIQKLPAFWAGENKWSFRYSSPLKGEYKFKTVCNDKKNEQLNNQEGTIKVRNYIGENLLYKHGALKVSDNRKYLEHLDGTPFLWLADSWWHGMTARFKWPDDFVQLTRDRKEKGFSVIQFAIAFPCDIFPFEKRGMNEAGNPWDENWNSIRPEYFEQTDKRVQLLIEEGLLPNIVGAWGYYIRFAGDEKMKKHWQYLIARYGAYPVTYTLCGESTLPWYLEENRQNYDKDYLRKEWSKVAEYIQRNDPYDRILTVHPGPNSGDLQPVYDMSNIDFVMLQSGHDGYLTLPGASETLDKALAKFPEKPVMHGEVSFEGMDGKCMADVQRFLFWHDMLHGTCGFSYGVEGIWQFNTEEELFGASPGGNTWGNVPWEIAHKYQGSVHVGIAKKILENYEWWKLTSSPEIIENPSSDLLRRPVCAQLPDGQFLVYIFRKPTKWGSYKLNGFKPDSKIEVLFWDPLTGDKYDGWSFNSDSKGILTIDNAPIMQDWVIQIHH